MLMSDACVVWLLAVLRPEGRWRKGIVITLDDSFVADAFLVVKPPCLLLFDHN